MPELSDEQVAKLAVTQWINLDLRLRDFGRVFVDRLPRPLRKALGRP